jgi:hypothetical protein
MGKAARYIGQGMLYGLFGVFIGYFSTSPKYEHLAPDQALLRLSFKHPGKIKAECRQRGAEELAKIPANMRQAMDCPRERSPVRVRVELDGKDLYDEAFPPTGLSKDGASIGYRRLPISVGRHYLKVQFNDDVRVAGFNFESEQAVEMKPGQVVLIDLAAEQGGVIIR